MTETKAREVADSFMRAWTFGNWEAMYQCSTKTWRSHKDNDRQALQEMFADVPLRFSWLGDEVVTSVVTDVRYRVFGQKHKPGIRVVRVIKEVAPYETGESGSWGVNPVSATRRMW